MDRMTGVSVQGGLCPGVSVKGVSVQGGLCPEGSLSGGSLSRGLYQGDLCPGGLSSRGVSVQGGFCLGTSLGRPPESEMSVYSSYWNAFLFGHIFLSFK